MNKGEAIKKYIAAILLYIGTTIWIICCHDEKFMMETCAVRYGIVLLLVLALHYLFVVKGIRIDKKKMLRNIFAVVLIGIVSAACIFCMVQLHILAFFSERYFMVVFVMLSIVYVIVSYCKNQLDDSKAMAIIIFLLGSLYSFSWPVITGVSFDDQIHYQRVLKGSHLGRNVATDADRLVISSAYNGGVMRLIEDKTVAKTQEEVDKLYESSDIEKYNLGEVGAALTVAYAPSSLAMVFARGLDLDYSYVIIFGRWAETWMYAIIIYLALRRLKSGKLIVFCISLFPTVLFLISNYSYDTWGIGIYMLAFCHYVGIMQSDTEKMNRKNLLTLCLLTFIAFLVKPIYFCLALVFLALPKEKLDQTLSIAKYRICIFLTSLGLLLSFALPFFVSGKGGNDMRGGEDVNSFEQVKYILSHPLAYTKTLLMFLKDYWSPRFSDKYISDFAYLYKARYGIVLFGIVLLIVFLDKNEVDLKVFSWKARLANFVWAFSASVFVVTSMYVAFTPVGTDAVYGCQSRYILPIIIVVAYSLGDYRLVKGIKPHIKQKALCTIVMAVFSGYALYALYTQYYSLL